MGEEQTLKLKGKEKQIEDLRQALKNARRRSEPGSQELQGEVLGLDVEAALTARFPTDTIRPVKKGVRGVDLIQTVRSESLQPCGTIVWEVTNARNWSNGWIEKLKDGQREADAMLAVLVSMTLPEGVRGFGSENGLWAVDRASYLALATALRHQLIKVARVQRTVTGVSAKMGALYNYLSGHEVRHRVEAIVEAFTALQAQLAREQRTMERQWAEREKQIERVITRTTGMYGSLAGIIGSSLPEIPALELDNVRLLEDSDA